MTSGKYGLLPAFGLGLAALGPAVILLGVGFDPFTLVFFLVPAIGTFLAWRFGTWATVVAVVLGFLLTTAAGSFAAEAVRYPESFFDFVPSLLVLIGALIALIFGVAALLNRRMIPDDRRTEAGVMRGVLSGFVVLSMVSAFLTMTQRMEVAEVPAGATEIRLEDTAFSPEAITLPAGERVQLLVRNRDRILHWVSLDAINMDSPAIGPRGDLSITFTAPAPGSYQFYCPPHSSEDADGKRDGMVATLTVT